MDWYYPILGGVLRGHAAEARLASKWDTFVAPGRGVRCVSDQPWVTAAETCELVMALDAIGLHERAHLVRVGAVPAPRRRLVLDRHELPRRPLRRDGASTSRPSSRRGTAPRSCSPPTRSAAPARPRACSAARGCPAGSPLQGVDRSGRRDRSRPRRRAIATDRPAGRTCSGAPERRISAVAVTIRARMRGWRSARSRSKIWDGRAAPRFAPRPSAPTLFPGRHPRPAGSWLRRNRPKSTRPSLRTRRRFRAVCTRAGPRPNPPQAAPEPRPLTALFDPRPDDFAPATPSRPNRPPGHLPGGHDRRVAVLRAHRTGRARSRTHDCTTAPTPSQAPNMDSQGEFLRLLEVVTSMCDHVIEYIEADRAERRLMIETLAQLGRVITDGSAAAVAAFTALSSAMNATRPAHSSRRPRRNAAGTRSRTGHRPGTPGARHRRLDAGRPGTPCRPRLRRSRIPTTPRSRPLASAKIHIAVEVRGQFGDRWVDGFEICEVMTTPTARATGSGAIATVSCSPSCSTRRASATSRPQACHKRSRSRCDAGDPQTRRAFDGLATGTNGDSRPSTVPGYWSRS